MSSRGSRPAVGRSSPRSSGAARRGPADRSGPASPPAERNSGSSLPMISLVHRKRSFQSSPGTPRIQEITADRQRRGHPLHEVELLVDRRRRGRPAPRTAMRSISSWRDRMALGSEPGHGHPAQRTVVGRVQHDDHLRRRRGATQVAEVRPWALENRSGWAAMSVMSACLVTAQNGHVALGLEEGHRRLRPQRGPHLVGVAAARRTGWGRRGRGGRPRPGR